ncbi:MAG: AGE family epimerase/isomerase [Chitinophagaceae bacterium]|nr:AGE family epimerase/isomerase [Chitinophagaceae bacterium]
MLTTEAVEILPVYREELIHELSSILDYWIKYTPDRKQGGFIGSIDNDNRVDETAPKGVVLNSRILWTFSAAYQYEAKPVYREMADKAYRYIVDHFIDRKYGGVYWSVDCMGNRLDTRKQIYGLAFCIYGLAEYYKISGDTMALHLAKDIYGKIEQYSFDKEKGGYYEAFTQGWKVTDDLRLSAKDDNEKKTMNTHLHIIEAYANLYSVWADEKLKDNIRHLLAVFDKYIINPQTRHLNLFMNENWQMRSSLISYGHDIEATWLLPECAAIINDDAYTGRFRKISIQLADAAVEGLDKDGGLWYEYEPGKDHWIKEKHSWPQAEAMVGFFHAYRVTGEEKYLQYSLDVWEFVKKHIKDTGKGEWFWGVHEDHSPMNKEKAGFWKCPYHNSRACMELIKRIAALNSKDAYKND